MRSLLFITLLLAFVASALAFDSDFLNEPVHDRVLIDKINNSPKVAWKATSYSQFEKMTLGEFRKRLGTVLIQKGTADMLPKKTIAPLVGAPAAFDSRTKWPNCVHPIRNQEQCGSCWAFSASEVLSDRFCIASTGKDNVVLSPQYMVSCDTSDYGCDGGYLNNAWNFLATTGIPTDSCVPYTSQNGDVAACPSTCQNGGSIKLYRAKNPQQLNDIPSIMADMEANGPVQAAFSVYRDFMSYKSGVYHHVSGSLLGGHAIKIVGWGVDSVSNKPYWIVANSWGPSWGLNGFFWILRGSDECGIEDNVWGAGVLL
uniref:Cathepsin B-like protein n=2 Tax=Naegleria fowleri TaxID=5763 RepID=X5D911_NAEFO|nr:cathepsin B-like protein [Naegleria fowleri]